MNDEYADINEPCENPQCNHKTYNQDRTPPPKITVEKIVDITNLIDIGNAFHCKKQFVYKGLNLRLLYKLVAPLTELNDMIGMNSLKTNIVDQLLYYIY